MTILENFLTWDALLTFGGCVAGTVFLTEWLKKIFTKVAPQIVSFVIASLILFIGHIATGTFVWAESPLYLINAIAVSLTANGGFDILKDAFSYTKDYPEELVFANMGEDSEETYLNLSRDPKEFKDGETVTFKVRQIKSQHWE